MNPALTKSFANLTFGYKVLWSDVRLDFDAAAVDPAAAHRNQRRKSLIGERNLKLLLDGWDTKIEDIEKGNQLPARSYRPVVRTLLEVLSIAEVG